MLVIKNLHKSFKVSSSRSSLILKNINYSFNDKGLYFIVGKSGSGKTTLLNVLSCLMKADSGEVIFNDIAHVNIGKKSYKILKTQFTSYKYIEDALIDGFSNNIFNKDTFNDLVHISSSYNTIYETIQNKPNIDMKDIFVTCTFNFTDMYQFI